MPNMTGRLGVPNNGSTPGCVWTTGKTCPDPLESLRNAAPIAIAEKCSPGYHPYQDAHQGNKFGNVPLIYYQMKRSQNDFGNSFGCYMSCNHYRTLVF